MRGISVINHDVSRGRNRRIRRFGNKKNKGRRAQSSWRARVPHRGFESRALSEIRAASSGASRPPATLLPIPEPLKLREAGGVPPPVRILHPKESKRVNFLWIVDGYTIHTRKELMFLPSIRPIGSIVRYFGRKCISNSKVSNFQCFSI